MKNKWIISSFVLLFAVTFFSNRGSDTENGLGMMDVSEQQEKSLKPFAKVLKASSLGSVEESRNPASKNITFKAVFMKNKKFVKYKDINSKAIASQKEKNERSKILKDKELLESVTDFLLSTSNEFNHQLEVAHLDASAFLIEAIKNSSDDKNVKSFINKMLEVDLLSLKKTMSKKTYTLLKEDKAEIMYEALAVSADLKGSYQPNAKDVESVKIYETVLKRYEINKEISKQMISQR